MLLVLWASLAAAADFVEILLWGLEKLDVLRTMLPFRHGIPSHDTLDEILNALDPALFSYQWRQAMTRLPICGFR